MSDLKKIHSKSSRQFISAEELAAIEEKEFSVPRLQQISDLFIFSCYTGLSYIDIYELTPENIVIKTNNSR